MFNKRTSYDIEIPAVVSNVKVRKLKLPYQKVEGSKEKILIVFDSVHRSDYRDNILSSGIIGDFLKVVDARSKKSCGQSIFASSVCTLNLQYAYVDKSESADTEEDDDDDSGNNADVEAIVDELNRKRLLKFIKEVQPTRIITMGKKSYTALKSFIDEPYLQQVEWSSLLGVPVAATIGKQKVKIVPMLNPNGICVYTTSREPYLIGYFIRCWTNAVLGRIRFDAGVRPDGVKTILVDTIEKFDKLYALLMRAPKVAIDTETDNLNRVANRLLMIQFAVDSKKAFILPYLHFDTPFTKKELTYIKEKLRHFFLENENELHIYCNANFDIPVIRHAFEFPYYKNEIWDIQAGEYALDENIVELVNVTAVGYYGLGNISIQYGFDGYVSGKFGKEDRVGISKLPLNTPGLLFYAAYDVVVPFAIQKRQVERGEAENHAKYQPVVKNLIGDTIHTFSTMNVNGILADQKHLWWLSSANSPIIEEVKAMEAKLLETDEVRQAEKLIGKENKVPTNTLFGSVVKRSNFSLRKKEHLRTLFFKVMGLEPVNVGADGASLDKEFQEEYRDNEIVAAYTSLNKAKKIRDAFVKSLIKIVSKNEDAKLTGRIRSVYKYWQVVTGRTASSDPNLQQVPSHGKLAAYIKRVFIAAPKTIFIKVDYSAHEVRGLALVGNDKVLAGSFQRGLDLYQEYLKNPTPLNLKKHAEEGDIHVINASFFFNLKASEVTKVIRQSVKAVVFGLIYGRSAPSIAAALGRPVEEVEEVMKKFFGRFKAGAAWLKDTVKFARANAYVEAPTGLRRHLWPYLLPVSKDNQRQWEPIAAACDRRANNSPIQGMGSGIGYSAARHLETWTFKRFRKWSLKNNKLPIRNQNMVHDSMEHEVQYTHIGYALEMIQESLTKGVQGKCIEKFGMKFPVDLSIEMDIGASLDTVEKWDGSIQSLHDLLKATFEFQRDTLKYKVDVEQELENVFKGYLPQFLIDQAKNGYFKEAKKYGMKVDKELFKKNQAELERQYKFLAEEKAKKEAEEALKKAAATAKADPKKHDAKSKQKDKAKSKAKSKA